MPGPGDIIMKRQSLCLHHTNYMSARKTNTVKC